MVETVVMASTPEEGRGLVWPANLIASAVPEPDMGFNTLNLLIFIRLLRRGAEAG
jgi:hypothetical protein